MLSITVTPFNVVADDSVEEDDVPMAQTYLEIPDDLKMPAEYGVDLDLGEFNADLIEEEFSPANGIMTFSTKASSLQWGSFTGQSDGTLDVFTQASGGSAITYISNGSYNSIVPILEKGSKRHKIAIGGIVGWVDNSYLKLVSYEPGKSVNYYIMEGNEFVHYISSGNKLYQSGRPTGIKDKTRYLSFDGHYFYEDTVSGFTKMIEGYNKNNHSSSVNSKNPFYNYFQYLPIKTQTNLKAADLKRHLTANGYNSIYKSKLYETEQLFIDHSNNQATNAAMMFATAVHESGFGGGFAKSRNNFFSHEAYDSSPSSASAYATPSLAIGLHSGRFIRWNYSDVLSSFYNGGILGDKSIGMNIKYASDPFWGEKIANHYYLIDKKAGFKDLHEYTLGIINSSALNVRQNSTTKSNIVYQNKVNKLPIAIIENAKGESINNSTTWYGFTSESLLDKNKKLVPWSENNKLDLRFRRFDIKNSTVYVHSSYITEVSKGKNSKIKSQPNPKIKSDPIFVEKPKTIYILSNLNLRPDNSTNYSSILTVPKETKITKAELTSNGWLLVQYDGHIGYVSAKYASYSKGGKPIIEEEKLPEVENPVEPEIPVPPITFKDVPKHNSFKEYIDSLFMDGIIKGYPDNTFRPNDSVTRAQAAKIIVLAAGIDSSNAKSDFKDVDKSSSSYKYISAAFEANIIEGYENKTIYKPNEPVSRAQVSKMIAKAFDLGLMIDIEKVNDVEQLSSKTLKDSVYIIMSHKIADGYSEGFRPTENVKRGQFSKMVDRARYPDKYVE